MKKIILVLLGIFIATASLLLAQTNKSWLTPDKYVKMKTEKATPASIAAGKTLYVKHCKSCHGSNGAGDGAKSAGLQTTMRSFTGKEFKSLGDGAIYYRSFVGRNEMPNYEKKIVAESDRWALVNYVKSLK